jgi:hypothetical protein
MKRSTDETLISALRILARDIQSEDGVANAAIAEAADRLAELSRDASRSSRADFEAWISQPPYERPVERFADDPNVAAWPGAYRVYDVQLAWEAWQESANNTRVVSNDELLFDIRDDVGQLLDALRFDWDSAPETLRRDAHRVARESLEQRI